MNLETVPPTSVITKHFVFRTTVWVTCILTAASNSGVETNACCKQSTVTWPWLIWNAGFADVFNILCRGTDGRQAYPLVISASLLTFLFWST